MTTRCITWMDTRSRIYVYISVPKHVRARTLPAASRHPAWPVALHPAHRNHPTMKHSITALTMLLIQQCPAKASPRARSLALDSVGSNWNRYHIVAASVRTSVTSVCTRLSAWLPTLVFRRAVKTVKTTARPIRHSAMFTTGR